VIPPGQQLPQSPDEPREHQEWDQQEQLLLLAPRGREQLEVDQEGEQEVDDNAVGDQVSHHLLLPHHGVGLELADAGNLCLQSFQHFEGRFFLSKL